MSDCQLPKLWLQAFLDGEPEHEDEVREHLMHCAVCATEVDTWRRSGDELRSTIDAALGDIEPLEALQKIRTRIEEAQRRSFWGRLAAFWEDTWRFHRGRVAGLATAAALGALCAPLAVYWLGDTPLGSLGPVVVVESLEVGGQATATVLGAQSGSTTLIWIEPSADDESDEESDDETF